MSYAVAAGGKFPFDIEMGTGDSTSAAFEAALVVYADSVVFQPVYVRRAYMQTRLVSAIVHANGPVLDFQMGGFVHVETCQK
jgi:hypothetical protein